jgi:predicted GNAT family acetyltransferase
MVSALHFRDPRPFLDRVGARLGAERIRYALILGVCDRLLKDPHEYGRADPWFMILERNGKVSALALRTPPFEVIVASFSGDHSGDAARMATEVSGVFETITGAVGEPDITDAFARMWCGSRGATIKHTMHQRVYGLAAVRPVRLSPGKLRQATAEDRDLVTGWVAAFQEDTFGDIDEDRVSDRSAKMLDRGDVYLWEDGQAVSVAARTRPTGEVITIGMVYTPPERRRRGYATSCVATLCGLLLESGYRYCTLYTDLSNPTSNKIYKEIGFTEVCDSVCHTFTYET